MRRTDILMAVAAVFLFLTFSGRVLAQPSGTVSVAVGNVPDNVGTIRVALCRRDEFLGQDCSLHAQVPAHEGTTIAEIPHVPAGVYAVQSFQDRDGDGRLGQNFLGIPQEPIGFSRDPALHFGPPSFEQCALAIGPDGGAVSLHLRTK